MYHQHLTKLPNITSEEKAFIEDLTRQMDHQGISLPRAISELYFAKKLELMVDKPSKSNDRNARALNWLTFALVIATLANAAVLIFK